MDQLKFLIYGLIDPRTQELRYVGKSCSGLERPARHAWPSYINRDHTHKGYWIRQLLREGLKYEIEVLEVHERPEDLPDAEMFWIAYFRSIGCRLTNMTAGGDGTCGTKKSAETRHRMSVARGGAEAKRAEAVELYRGGLSTRAVARRLGIGVGTSFDFVRDAGVLRGRSESVRTSPRKPRKSSVSEETLVAMSDKYVCGASLPTLSDQYGMSVSHIWRLLRRRGVAMRSRIEAARDAKRLRRSA